MVAARSKANKVASKKAPSFPTALTLELAAIMLSVRYATVGTERDEPGGQTHHAKCYHCGGRSRETAPDCIRARELAITHTWVDCVGKLAEALDRRRLTEPEVQRLFREGTYEIQTPTTPTGILVRQGSDERDAELQGRHAERLRETAQSNPWTREQGGHHVD